MQLPAKCYYRPPGTNTQLYFPPCLRLEIFKLNQLVEGNESLETDEERNFSEGATQDK